VPVKPWLPPPALEDDLAEPVILAELAGLKILIPALESDYAAGFRALAGMSSAIAGVLATSEIVRAWQRAADEAARASARHWEREAKRAGLTTDEPDLPPKTIDRWRWENEDRYELVRDEVKTSTRDRMRSARDSGMMAATLAGLFASRGLPTHNGQMRGRGRIIAADQLGTLSGMIAKRQQIDAGIEIYRWRDRGDSRVRESHEALAGLLFHWDAPPSIGHPGHPINCRCWAEAVV